MNFYCNGDYRLLSFTLKVHEYAKIQEAVEFLIEFKDKIYEHEAINLHSTILYPENEKAVVQLIVSVDGSVLTIVSLHTNALVAFQHAFGTHHHPELGLYFSLKPGQSMLTEKPTTKYSQTLSMHQKNIIEAKLATLTFLDISLDAECSGIVIELKYIDQIYYALLGTSLSIQNSFGSHHLLCITVYGSTFLFGKKLLGYSTVAIPNNSQKMQIVLWKPLGNYRQRFADYFTGSGLEVRDIQSIPQTDEKVLTLNGFHTRPSGMITVDIRLEPKLMITERKVIDHTLLGLKEQVERTKRKLEEIKKMT